MTYYDEIAFLTYVPDNVLPKEVSTYASALDFAPTFMQILGLNGPNTLKAIPF